MKNYLEPLKIFTFLTRRERTAVFSSFIFRALLVVLDLAGLSLIGLTVSQITKTHLEPNSISGLILSFVKEEFSIQPSVVFAVTAVVFFVIKAILSIRVNKIIFSLFSRIELRLVSSTFQTVASQDLQYVSNLHKKDLSFGLLDSFDYAFSKQLTAISVLVGEIFLTIGVLTYLLILDFELTVMTVIFFSVVVMTTQNLVATKMSRAAALLRDNSSKSNEAAINLIENFRQLKVLDRQHYFVEKFKDSRKIYAQSNSQISQASVLPRYLTEISLVIGLALLLIFQESSHSSDVPTNVLAIFIAGCFRIVASLLPLQGSLGVLLQVKEHSKVALRYLSELSEPQQKSESKRQHTTSIPWAIEVQNLGFRYDDRNEWQFRHLSFSVRHGSVLVLKGKSGAGKSTLADLLLGLRQPTEGTIQLKGSTGEYHAPAECRNIAYVPQETTIFSGTLSENVCLRPSHEIDFTKLEQAASNAGILELIHSLDKSFETLIGPSESGLSGGQKQRVSIARALYLEPKLLILDESTSALDKGTAADLHEVFFKLKGNVTIIAISHADEFDEYADVILNLEGS